MGIGTDTNDGTITVKEMDTGVPFVTGRYAEVVLLYNMSNNDVCVQYDGTTVVAWAGTDAPSLTQIVYAAFFRMPDAFTNQNLFVDHVLMDKPTPGTLAWWRYETPGNNVASDHAGHFAASRAAGYFPTQILGATDPLYDGLQDRHNDWAMADFRLSELLPSAQSPRMSEWTLESIFSAQPGILGPFEVNLQFLDWGTDLGHNSTNSHIGFIWLRTDQNLALNLRDAQQTSSATHSLWGLGFVPPDSRWHHVAAVKTGSWLTVYVDYRGAANIPLSSVSSGYYEFAANSHAYVGQTLNGGNTTSTNHLLDELRFTARALSTAEFLQFGQPMIISTPAPSAATWDLNVLTISGCTFNVQTAPMPGSFAWTDILPATIATGHYSRFSIPAPTNRILRVIRP